MTKVLKTLDRIGWFGELPTLERKRIARDYAAATKRDPTYAFYALAVTTFDPECIEEVGPAVCSYYSVITQLADASYGLFSPSHIKDSLDTSKGKASVSFRHLGKRYACTVPFKDDWFQEGVLDLINRAISESGRQSQFLSLPICDQTASLVLVRPEVFDAAVREGLIPEDHLIDE